MVTFAQAQERAEEWINGDVPSYQHREVRVREFGLGFVVWAEDRAEGPRSDGGAQRLVIARDSGEATLWPGLPVGEVIRRYEEEYGVREAPARQAPAPAARGDLNQTSFLLSPPEWLQEEADRRGAPDRPQGGGVPSAPPSGATAGAPGGVGSSPGAAAGSAPVAAAGNAPVAAAGNAPVAAAGNAPIAAAAAASGPSVASGSSEASGAGVPGVSGTTSVPAWPAAGGGDEVRDAVPGVPEGATPWAGTDTNADGGEDRSVPLPATVIAPPLSDADDGTPPGASAPDAKITLQGGPGVPQGVPGPGVPQGGPGVPHGGPGVPQGGPGVPQGPPPPPGPPPPGGPQPPGVPQAPGVPQMPNVPQAPGVPQMPNVPQAPGVPQIPNVPQAPDGSSGPGRRLAPNAEDIADAATSKAAPPRAARAGGAPPPPGAPGVPGARPGATPQPSAPGAPGGGYVPTQLVSQLGPEGPGAPVAPGTPPPGAPQPPAGTPGGVHHAATMLAGPPVGPGVPPGTPSAPNPPGPPNRPGVPGAPSAPGVPAASGIPAAPGAPGAPGVPAAPGAVHHAETVLAGPPVGGPGVPPPPGVPGAAPADPGPVPGQQPSYGYPQSVPTVGPGYQAVLRYRAPDGSEQQLIRRSAPGTPHPEWQIFHELRGLNVPPDQVLELHTELESCELPGAYCARMIRENWPQARIASIAPYGTDHASRQQGMQQLLAHQGELHQVADGPARPGPVRAPLPPVQPAPPIPPEGIAQEMAAAFGPGVFRFEQAAVSRQGVPPIVAQLLVVAGLPVDMGPFFWAQAQPGRPVPTLAELAQERGLQPAADAGSYLVLGSDFGKAICVQYGTANIVAVPVEAGPGGVSAPPQYVNTGLPEFVRCLALLGRMWRLRYGLNQEQAGRWTVDFQAQLASLDPAALGSPDSWWSVLLEQMWDGLL
ncbi:SUKH-4 family immunity protein [Streptomyces glomeratus]|uniref:SUKH-4 family immunity protein n=2 Tax=Streptomyces glomeratus TaxID=284452 RepID=UPI001F2B642E|nr:SUKH-4 family immunity protein [Streptomyces glomeratus]MCF1506321.1 SUKH-4 family immunity protein [Streptomyces glomeratus]